MPKPPAKKRLRSSPVLSTQREREDTRILVYQGYSVREAARLVGISEATALAWSAKENWLADVQRIRALAQSQIQPREEPTMQNHQQQSHSGTAQSVAYDLAKTNRETRSLLARGIHKAARHIADGMMPEEMINAGPQVKAIVSSAKEIDGTWQDSSASKFAVSLQINQMVQGGLVQDIPEGAICIEEETGQILFQP